MMLDVVSRKSKIGKILDELEWTNGMVAEDLDVATGTVSYWRNLKDDGTPRQPISSAHLEELVRVIKKKANLIIDPSDLAEDPEYYTNTIKVVATMTDNFKIKNFSRQKKVKVDTKFPPDTAAIEMVRNSNKTYYYIFEEVDREPNKSLIHNSDAVLYDGNGILAVARDIQIFGDQLKYLNTALTYSRKIDAVKPKTIPINKVKYFNLITCVKIILTN